MILKTKYFLFVALLLVASVTSLLPVAQVRADHTITHCNEQIPSNLTAEREICYSGIPDTVAEWNAWCDRNIPTSLTAERQICYNDIPASINQGGGEPTNPNAEESTGDDEPPGFNPTVENPEFVVGDTTLTCDENNPTAESDNIVCQLNRIVNFLSVGVVIVAAITVGISGLQYLSARGDPNKTSQAIKRMIQVAVGLVTYGLGWALINWLIPGGVI